MSTASQPRFSEPLTQFVRDLAGWLTLLRQRGLLRRGEGPDDPDQDVHASDELEQFRGPAKAIIVWLELHGRDADAAEVDDAMAALRETARRFDTGELKPIFDECADEHLSPLDLLIQAASETAGRLEDLDANIPSDVWQGFGEPHQAAGPRDDAGQGRRASPLVTDRRGRGPPRRRQFNRCRAGAGA